MREYEELVKKVSLRDYFAAVAMQAIITANGTFDYDEEPVALNAYKMADIMLQERERWYD